MSGLASAIIARKELRESLTAKILKGTAELDTPGSKSFTAQESELTSLWQNLDRLDPATPDPQDDLQVSMLKSRHRDIASKQERLAALMLRGVADDGGDVLGGREDALRRYETELMGLADVLASLSETE